MGCPRTGNYALEQAITLDAGPRTRTAEKQIIVAENPAAHARIGGRLGEDGLIGDSLQVQGTLVVSYQYSAQHLLLKVLPSDVKQSTFTEPGASEQHPWL